MQRFVFAFGNRLADSTPRKIVWRLSPEVLHHIRRAEAKLSDLINKVLAHSVRIQYWEPKAEHGFVLLLRMHTGIQTEVECLEFSGFGKSAIVDVNCSPDAFVQLA